jgi:hypothetical protein
MHVRLRGGSIIFLHQCSERLHVGLPYGASKGGMLSPPGSLRSSGVERESA